MTQAKFITFEGVDGAGKSTHLAWFIQALRQRGIDVIVTRGDGSSHFPGNLAAHNRAVGRYQKGTSKNSFCGQIAALRGVGSGRPLVRA